MRSLSVTLLAASVFVTASARAQMMANPVQDYINKTTLLNNILSNARATDMSQRAQIKGSAAAPAAPGSATGASVAPTSFRHAGRSLLPAQLAARAAGTAEQKRQAEQFFESQLELYNRTATNDRFPANDLAYAMEYLIVNSYMVYHDLHDVPYEKDSRVKRGKDSFDRIAIINQKKALKPTPLKERAVYIQLQHTLAANPRVARLSDREKQEMAETLAIMLGVNYATCMQG